MAKTGHPNFVYVVSSPWRNARHAWSITGNHSGSSLNGSQAQTFMTGAASPFALSYAPFLSAHLFTGGGYGNYLHQVIRAAYYDGQNSAPVWEAEYDGSSPPPTTLFPTGTAFTNGSDIDIYGDLEGCCELRAQIGVSKTNKPIFVRKFLHGLASTWVTTTVLGDQSIALSTDGIDAMEAQNNGTWYNGLVYISPSGAQPTAGAWEVIPGNHQMPRGRRKVSAKAASKANNTLLSLLETGAIAIGSNLLTDAL